MGIDSQSFRFFLDLISLAIFAANPYRNLHQYALAAPPGP